MRPADETRPGGGDAHRAMTRIALCFPGQGSQAAGMAAGLDATALGRRLLEVAAGMGADLASALGGDEEAIRPTEVAQPALVFTETVLLAALPPELEPVAVGGHSVGELAACTAAGVLEPEVALRLSVERGRLMGGMREGVMAAVLGVDAEVLERLCAEVEGTVVVANRNAPGQVVISGTRDAVAEASAAAQAAGARRVVPLRVSGAFHSPLMEEASTAFGRVLDLVPMRPATVPLVANVDAQAVREAADIRERLRLQMVSTVNWSESVRRMVDLGAEALVEIGPGSVLTGLARRIAPQVPAFSASTLAAVAGLGEQIEARSRG